MVRKTAGIPCNKQIIDPSVLGCSRAVHHPAWNPDPAIWWNDPHITSSGAGNRAVGGYNQLPLAMPMRRDFGRLISKV
ncbi:hypothetical protein AA102526_2377 [Asaia lannensis NBRC 102526]|nr:hypothetical protein AA102526_2377 [Asaia lannensis NBRC 102526]